MSIANSSQDLVWELTRGNNSYLVKRRSAGGVLLSRDPMNLMNKHSRKYEGFVNDKAIGIQTRPNAERGLQLTTKKPAKVSTPANALTITTFGGATSSRKTSRGVVNRTAKSGYRPDLRAEAVSRASAIKRSQNSERKVRDAKPRGAKARAKAARADASAS